MLPFVQSVASQQVPPPYHFPGVTVDAFVWDAPLGPIQHFCDTYLNLGDPAERGFVYKPLAAWPYATLLMIDYPVMICSDRRQMDINLMSYADRGYMTQHEVFVALPLVRYGTTASNFITNGTIEWALPFIVVENPMSAICGREMLGLEKLLGTIDLGESQFPGSFRGSIELPGWPSLDPNVMQERMKFLEVNTGPATPTFRGSPNEDSPWTLLRSPAAGDAISTLAALNDFVGSISAGLIPTAMQVVTLKQIRDATHPDHAVYQSLVSCRAKYSNITNLKFYNEQDVTIAFNDQGSFSEILRVFLGPDQLKPFKPTAAYRFGADIDFDNMRTLYNFPIDPPDGGPPSVAHGDMLAPWLRPLRGFFGPRTTGVAV